MAYAAKPDGAWVDRAAVGGTNASNLIGADDCNRWEANQLDANTRLTTVEGGAVTSTAIDLIVQVTQAQYNALGTPSARTLYLIVG